VSPAPWSDARAPLRCRHRDDEAIREGISPTPCTPSGLPVTPHLSSPLALPFSPRQIHAPEGPRCRRRAPPRRPPSPRSSVKSSRSTVVCYDDHGYQLAPGAPASPDPRRLQPPAAVLAVAAPSAPRLPRARSERLHPAVSLSSLPCFSSLSLDARSEPPSFSCTRRRRSPHRRGSGQLRVRRSPPLCSWGSQERNAHAHASPRGP
jgi:hypothetical protein